MNQINNQEGFYIQSLLNNQAIKQVVSIVSNWARVPILGGGGNFPGYQRTLIENLSSECIDFKIVLAAGRGPGVPGGGAEQGEELGQEQELPQHPLLGRVHRRGLHRQAPVEGGHNPVTIALSYLHYHTSHSAVSLHAATVFQPMY